MQELRQDTQWLSLLLKYMIDTPSNNPKLSFEQLQAIDITQKRLAVLESEINNASKVLKGTKVECDNAVKENKYQQEQLITIITQVDNKKKELSDLVVNCEENSSKLKTLNDEIKNKTTKQLEIEELNSQKAQKLDSMIKEEQVRLDELSKKEEVHHKNSLDLLIKVNKLKDFAKSL